MSRNKCKEIITKEFYFGKYGVTQEQYRDVMQACRAGSTTAYSWSDKIYPTLANYKDSRSLTVEPVGVDSYRPNASGLYDMHGNVSKWSVGRYWNLPYGYVYRSGAISGLIQVNRVVITLAMRSIWVRVSLS